MKLDTLFSLGGEDEKCLKILKNPLSNNLIFVLNTVKIVLESSPSGLLSAINNVTNTDSTLEPFKLETFSGFIKQLEGYFEITIIIDGYEDINLMPLEIDKFNMVLVNHY